VTVDLTDRRDVVSHVLAQHERIRDLFEQVEDASPGRRADVFQPLIRLLAVHETAEEMVIYPALTFAGSDALAVVRDRKAEEDKAKKSLARLEGLDASSSTFLRALREFRDDVLDHASAEEREVLPLLAEKHRDFELKSMDMAFNMAQLVAPTHAHRFAPESLTGNLVLGPMVAVVDRFRDAVRDAVRQMS
jgi:hemerythrin superfamily protein